MSLPSLRFEGCRSERRILTRIAATGRHEPHLAAVESFVERVLALTDEERKVVAERRRVLDEAFREKAVRAGLEAAAAHAELYVRARARIGGAHLPTTLEEGDRDSEWSDVARLVELAVDEGLLAFVGQATLHPNHLRELIAPWPV
jgi:hypothetical protein